MSVVYVNGVKTSCIAIEGGAEKLIYVNKPYSDASPVIYEEIIDATIVDKITIANENTVSSNGGPQGTYKEVTKSKLEIYVKLTENGEYTLISNDDYILSCYQYANGNFIYKILYYAENTYIYAIKIKFTDVYRVSAQIYYNVKTPIPEPIDSNLIAYWDFIESQSQQAGDFIDDKINHFVLKKNGLTYTTDGLYTPNSSAYASIPTSLLEKNRAYEIEFGEINGSSTSNLNRILSHRTDTNASHGNSGFGWNSGGYWGVWDSTNQWQNSDISDINYFSNSILRIEIDSDGKWKIYKNGVLVFSPPLALPLTTVPVFQLGSSQYSLYTMTIKSFRIYKLPTT